MADRAYTDLELERSLAGELDLDLERRATAADRARLDQLRTHHAAFLDGVDLDAEVTAIRRRATPQVTASRRLGWPRWLVSGGALALAAAAVIVLVGRIRSPDDDVRTKGDVSLIVHLARGSGTTRVTSGDVAAAGDRLRFEIAAPGPGYVAIVGIDATGTTSVYYPSSADRPAAIDPRVEPLLPGAIELDATPGDETFYALFAVQPFAVSRELARIRAGTALSDGVKRAEIVLHKR